MRKSLVLPIALLMGCFAPDLSGITFKCDADRACPDGYTCSTGECKVPGDVPVPTPNPTPGCSGTNGSDVSGSGTGKVWACPGKWDQSQLASGLCATGYSICKDASAVNLGICNAKSGFFFADVGVYKANGNRLDCGSNNNLWDRGFAGCGTSPDNQQKASSICGGFNRAIIGTDSTLLKVLKANDTLAKSTENTSSENGVLCCKN